MLGCHHLTQKRIWEKILFKTCCKNDKNAKNAKEDKNAKNAKDKEKFPGANPSPAATPDSEERAKHQCHCRSGRILYIV